LDGHVAGEVLEDSLIHHGAFILASLVLRVNPILGFFDTGRLELLEIVVLVAPLLIVLLLVLLVDESKGLVMDG
jgi:hypothetical protein